MWVKVSAPFLSGTLLVRMDKSLIDKVQLEGAGVLWTQGRH